MMRWVRTLSLLLGVAATVCGCGGSDGPTLVAVRGTVTFQAKPLAGATVTFVPEKGPIAVGTTDVAGKFVLATGNSPGAVIGKCKVAVSVLTPEGDDPELKQDLSESERNEILTQRMGKSVGKFGKDKPRGLLPDKYANPATSGLEALISDRSDKNDFEFKL